MNTQLIEQIKGGIKGLIKQRMDWVRDARESRNILQFVSQLPDMPEDMQFRGIEENIIKLQHPYNKIIRQQVHEYLLSLGWEVEWIITEADCKSSWDDPKINYVNKSMIVATKNNIPKYLHIIITYADDQKGSTCKRKLIGEKKVERVEEIYEWVCEDAITEMEGQE